MGLFQMIVDPSAVNLLLPAVATISITERDGRVVLTVSGEIDITNSDELLDAIFSQSHAKFGVVVDLTSVSFVDSTTLVALARAQRRYEACGVDISITERRMSKIS